MKAKAFIVHFALNRTIELVQNQQNAVVKKHL